MSEDLARRIGAVRARAVEAQWRADLSAQRARRLDELASSGTDEARARLARQAAMTWQAVDRHLASVRVHESYLKLLRDSTGDSDGGRQVPHLARAVAEVVAVTSLAIALHTRTGNLAAVFASDGRSRGASDLELVLGGGPASEASRTRRVVHAQGSELEQRWPQYAALARDLGVRAVAAVPIHVGAGANGSLAVFDEGFVRSVRDLGPLETLAEGFLDSVLGELRDQSEVPGEHAHLVHNAAGIVSVQVGCDPSAADALIRARAFAEGAPVFAVAKAVVEGTLTLDDGP